jgi:hypothetical protein
MGPYIWLLTLEDTFQWAIGETLHFRRWIDNSEAGKQAKMFSRRRKRSAGDSPVSNAVSTAGNGQPAPATEWHNARVLSVRRRMPPN